MTRGLWAPGRFAACKCVRGIRGLLKNWDWAAQLSNTPVPNPLARATPPEAAPHAHRTEPIMKSRPDSTMSNACPSRERVTSKATDLAEPPLLATPVANDLPPLTCAYSADLREREHMATPKSFPPLACDFAATHAARAPRGKRIGKRAPAHPGTYCAAFRSIPSVGSRPRSTI